MYAMMKTMAACLRLHGYWEDINSQAWMSVCGDWNHSTQSSNNKLSPLPFLPSPFSSPAASHNSRGREEGRFSPSSFLSSTSCLPAFVICQRRRARACRLLCQRRRKVCCLPTCLSLGVWAGYICIYSRGNTKQITGSDVLVTKGIYWKTKHLYLIPAVQLLDVVALANSRVTQCWTEFFFCLLS